MTATLANPWRSFDGRDPREGIAYEVWHAAADWMSDRGIADMAYDELALRCRHTKLFGYDAIEYDLGESTYMVVAYEYDGAPDARPHTDIFVVALCAHPQEKP